MRDTLALVDSDGAYFDDASLDDIVACLANPHAQVDLESLGRIGALPGKLYYLALIESHDGCDSDACALVGSGYVPHTICPSDKQVAVARDAAILTLEAIASDDEIARERHEQRVIEIMNEFVADYVHEECV